MIGVVRIGAGVCLGEEDQANPGAAQLPWKFVLKGAALLGGGNEEPGSPKKKGLDLTRRKRAGWAKNGLAGGRFTAATARRRGSAHRGRDYERAEKPAAT